MEMLLRKHFNEYKKGDRLREDEITWEVTNVVKKIITRQRVKHDGSLEDATPQPVTREDLSQSEHLGCNYTTADGTCIEWQFRDGVWKHVYAIGHRLYQDGKFWQVTNVEQGGNITRQSVKANGTLDMEAAAEQVTRETLSQSTLLGHKYKTYDGIVWQFSGDWKPTNAYAVGDRLKCQDGHTWHVSKVEGENIYIKYVHPESGLLHAKETMHTPAQYMNYDPVGHTYTSDSIKWQFSDGVWKQCTYAVGDRLSQGGNTWQVTNVEGAFIYIKWVNGGHPEGVAYQQTLADLKEFTHLGHYSKDSDGTWTSVSRRRLANRLPLTIRLNNAQC